MKKRKNNMKIENYIGENPIIISCYSILFPIFLPFSNKNVFSSHHKPHPPVNIYATVWLWMEASSIEYGISEKCLQFNPMCNRRNASHTGNMYKLLRRSYKPQPTVNNSFANKFKYHFTLLQLLLTTHFLVMSLMRLFAINFKYTSY